MSDSDSELNQYGIPVMAMIFKGFAASEDTTRLSTSLAMVESATFSVV